MATRTLNSSPSVLPSFARAAASMIPGASLLPFVPGGGKEIPDIELVLSRVRVDTDKLAAYAKVCGFSLRETLPATYPHMLAFPLHMAAMADGHFPFGAVGLVHIENRIVQHRPIGTGEELEIRVRTTPLEAHPRGRAFSFVSEARVDGELVWEDVSRYLRRGGGGSQAQESGASTATPQGSAGQVGGESPIGGPTEEQELSGGAEWKLPGDLGRRYASVSGDRNPIHMHSLLAKPLGFPRAIAHGMWTKARCLAALESRLADAFSVDVRFRKPILLPARVVFTSAGQGQQIDFAVRDAKRGAPHLEGHTQTLTPAEQATGGSEK
ncbi:MAG: MaoC/PaaZ C-terminal domain-containing protein [Solirubrobacteraceae bacterium]